MWVDELSSRVWVARHDARCHLVKVGDAAVAVVSALVEDQREEVRWEAAKTLSDIASPSAAKALIRALTDEDGFGVRWVAAEGLIRLGRDALPALLQSLEAHPRSVYLRVGAHHLLYEHRRRGEDGVVSTVYAALGRLSPAVELPLAAHEALIKLRGARAESPPDASVHQCALGRRSRQQVNALPPRPRRPTARNEPERVSRRQTGRVPLPNRR